MNKAKKHLIITGSKRSGKTTMLNKILKEERLVGGIVTYAIRDDKYCPKLVMLRDINDPNSKGIIGVRSKSETSLIPLNDTFETLGTYILKKYLYSDAKLIVIDEIGFLENFAINYQKAILDCLEKKRVIYVVKKEFTPLIEKIIKRNDIWLIDVDIEC